MLCRRNPSEPKAPLYFPAQSIYALLMNRRNSEVVTPDPENQLVLTKGDNNPVDDIALYRGLKHLERKHVVGKVRGYVPTVVALSWVPFLSRICLGSCHMWATSLSPW